MQPNKEWRLLDENAPKEIEDSSRYIIIEWDGKQYYKPVPTPMQGNHKAN